MLQRLVRYAFLLILVPAALTGCGGGGKSGISGGGSTPTPPAPTYPNVTGDWGVTASSTVHSGQTFPIGAELTSSGSAITGTAHLVSACYAVATNVPVSGTVDTSGNLSLTSSVVSGQTLTITGNVSSGNAITAGMYSVSGGCADGDKGTITGGTVAALTGMYMGTIKSASGMSVGVSLQITQSSAVDASGFFHLTGTAIFNNSPCFTSTAIANTTTDTAVIGLYYGANFTSTSPVSAIYTTGTMTADAKTVNLAYEIVGGVCAGDIGTGTLTKQ